MFQHNAEFLLGVGFEISKIIINSRNNKTSPRTFLPLLTEKFKRQKLYTSRSLALEGGLWRGKKVVSIAEGRM
jgi:hypothetical protein